MDHTKEWIDDDGTMRSHKNDFIHLLKKGFVQPLFERSVRNVLGENWREDGEKLLKGNEPLLAKFKKYADNKTTA